MSRSVANVLQFFRHLFNRDGRMIYLTNVRDDEESDFPPTEQMFHQTFHSQ